MFTLGLLVALGTNAQAANFAVITTPPVYLNIFVLLIALGCVVGSAKISSLVRGGNLGKSWQIFILGFIAFTAGQLVILLDQFEIITLPIFVVPFLMLAAAGLLLYGILETKKVLD